MKSIKEKILSTTNEETCFYDIAQSSKNPKTSTIKALPRLEEVDFYRGYKVPELEFVPQSVKSRKTSKEQRNQRRFIDLSLIFNNFERGQITFVGQAGSGKTTLLKYIARCIIAKKFEKLQEIEYVHFLQGRNLFTTDFVSPADLLLGNHEHMSEKDKNQYMHFVKANPSKVVIILDSLDTIPYALEDENQPMKIQDSSSPARILWNLLTGRLFPGCRVITSSREHKIRNFTKRLRADRVFALVGLSRESIDKIVAGYFDDDKGKKIIHQLEVKSPLLLALCQTPVFLSFTFMGLERDFSFSPSTLTGVIFPLLENLSHSIHTYRENIEEVLKKLSHLAFAVSKEGKVIFSKTELAEYDLTEDDVTDLAVIAPGGRTQSLLKQEYALFFCHQSIQEALAAMHIANMELEQFESFITNHIHTQHYAVIRRILCGILLDKEILMTSCMPEAGVQSLKEKQTCLKESMKAQILQDMWGVDQLELLISLNEAKGGMVDVITSSMKVMDIQELPLLTSDIHTVGSILQQCTEMQSLILRKCSLDSQALRILTSYVKKSSVQVLTKLPLELLLILLTYNEVRKPHNFY